MYTVCDDYVEIIQNTQHSNTLNQIISENKPYNFRLCTFTFHTFQEKNLNMNREVRVRIPVQVQIFLLKFIKSITLLQKYRSPIPI
jgi:hypothetical protein